MERSNDSGTFTQMINLWQCTTVQLILRFCINAEINCCDKENKNLWMVKHFYKTKPFPIRKTKIPQRHDNVF